MAIDQDPQTLGQWFLMVLGLGGGAAKFVTHEGRIKRLETDRERDQVKLDARFEKHDSKLDAVNAKVDSINLLMAGVSTKIDGLKDDIIQNRDLYVRRRKQHIIDMGGEIED